MSYRRQEMERNLPEASQYLCKFLWQNCREAGLSISDEDILFIGKLVSSYVKDTLQGKQTFLKLLNLELKQASNLNTYYKAGRVRAEDSKIKSTDLAEVRGWLYKNSSLVKFTDVVVDEKENTAICDSCGGSFPKDYCMLNVEVLRETGLRLESRCNYCRYHSEHANVRDTGSTRTCEGCEKVACEYHPRHSESMLPPQQQQPLALLPSRIAPAQEQALPAAWTR